MIYHFHQLLHNRYNC